MEPLLIILASLGAIIIIAIINAVWQAERNVSPERAKSEDTVSMDEAHAPELPAAYQSLAEPALSHPLAKASDTGEVAAYQPAIRPIAKPRQREEAGQGRYVAFVQYTELTVIRRRS